MKKPKPTASSLRRKSGWVITSSRSASETIAPAMNAPRIASSPSVSASAAKPTSSTSAARTRICAVVSCRRRRSARMRIECSAPRTTSEDGRGEQEQRAQQQQRRPRPALAREEDREQDDRPEVGDRRGGDDQLPEGGGDLARVLEHRDEHAERRRAEDDRDQQRRVHQPARLEPERDDEGDREREREPEQRDPQHLPAQLLELDLQAGQEEHEREPEQRDHLDRLVDLDDPEHRRADDDPGDDLEHDGGELHARERGRAAAARRTRSPSRRGGW